MALWSTFPSHNKDNRLDFNAFNTNILYRFSNAKIVSGEVDLIEIFIEN